MLETFIHSIYKNFVEPCIPGIVTITVIVMAFFSLIGIICAENRKERIGVVIFFFASTTALIILEIILLASFSFIAMILFFVLIILIWSTCF